MKNNSFNILNFAILTKNFSFSFSFTQNEQFSNNVCKTFALKVKQKLFQEFAEK